MLFLWGPVIPLFLHCVSFHLTTIIYSCHHYHTPARERKKGKTERQREREREKERCIIMLIHKGIRTMLHRFFFLIFNFSHLPITRTCNQYRTPAREREREEREKERQRGKRKIMIDWLIDWFLRHDNMSRVILCLEVRESCSVYVYINIFFL